jgi:undecaprenyl phosphate N,N'-diacetylbacillosamine 1-phosphate transferase
VFGFFYSTIFKPLGDFFAALVLLILLSPIILVTIILLLITNKGSVFFFQQRPGLNSVPFNIIKFKTMRDAFDKEGKPLPDDVRLTKIGRIVRSFSIDELLQLINVIRGDMSLVGPRPLLMRYLNRYSPEQARRHLVKPGITGWAQVNGRNAICWQDKFELDVFYVDNQSFLLDCKILWMTLLNVIFRKNINASENLTMSEFLGNDTQST